MLSTWQQLAAGLSGLVGGTLAGFFGVGGNVILIPMLVATLGVSQHQAQGLTLAALLPPLALPAVWQYRKAGVPLQLRVVAAGVVGFLFAIPLGSAVANQLPASVLRGIFSGILLITAVRTWRTTKQDDGEHHLELPRWGLVFAALSGFGAGFLGGLLGIGGAIVLIPMLRRFLGYSQKQAQLTSLAMLLPPIALPGVIVYARAQEVMPWGALIPIACGFALGAFAGARLNRVVKPAPLQRGFAVLLLVSAGVLMFSATR